MSGEDDALSELMQRLGHRFASPALLVEALTHPSAVSRERPRSYERMEFLGDRVLALVLAEMLFARFPDEAEGPLAKRLSVLAQRETLTEVALDLDLGPDLIVAASEEMSGGRANPTTLGDALEALLGAVYLDGGKAPAEALVRRFWEPLLERTAEPPQDAKTGLQEWAQARGLALPRYREVGRSGPPHEPLFTIEVSVTGHEPAIAAGRSKRAAERAAAEALLDRVLGRQP